MKARIMAGVAATALALSMGVATAGEIGGSAIMDGASPGYLQQQQQLRNEPGYSIGTGAAYIGDGSDPAYEATQRALRTTPGYQFGEAIAQVHYMP
jgi:hypothetical protein